MAQSPYKGLMPYAEADAPFFFGREEETRVIVSNLFASRLTILYGARGVGKTSLLRAGVAPQVRRLHERAGEEAAVVVFSQWQGDALAELKRAVAEAVAGARADSLPFPTGAQTSLRDLVREATDYLRGDLFIILDQFEEYFLYHPRDAGARAFDREFAETVNERRLPVSFLLCIREELFSKLDRFKGDIPELFANYLRLNPLSPSAAREAVVRPVERYNQMTAGESFAVESELAARVVEAVSRLRVVGPPDSPAEAEADGGGVEAPYLQLIMARLWEEENYIRSRVLRLATLLRLGGAANIINKHVDNIMAAFSGDEREISARLFQFLITPSGTKITQTASDLAEFAGLPVSQVVPVLEKLARTDAALLRRVRMAGRPEPGYEIINDVLGDAVTDWRQRYMREPTETPRVFISYSWEDKERVRQISDELRAAGAQVWIDNTGIRGGDNLPKRISEALEWCNVLLLLWSEAARESHWVEVEWTNALSLKKTIIPCLLSRTRLPGILASKAYVDLMDAGNGRAQLLRALNLAGR